MKFVIAAIAVISLTISANAGTLVFEAEEEEEIIVIEDEPMGTSQTASLPSNSATSGFATKFQRASAHKSRR